jgi:uncharacterized repeat protein (TIGR02543 family)
MKLWKYFTILALFALNICCDNNDNNTGSAKFPDEPDEPHSYIVVYNSNEGIGDMEKSNFTYGISQNLRKNSFTRIGYTFIGWATSSSGTVVYLNEQNVNNLTTSAGATVILYAVWYLSTVPGSNLSDKLLWLQANAISNIDYTVEINIDENIEPVDLFYDGKTDIGINLISADSERIIRPSSDGGLFTVWGGVTLILGDNITLKGHATNNNHLVQINNNGTLIMNAGSRIIDNSAFITTGSGGVYVTNGGTFIMNGGEISGNSTLNYGGGVHIRNGIFTMNSGKISGNSVSYHGGGVCIYYGTFTMNGGEISGNSASPNGGGVYVFYGTFIMNDGEISGNSATSNFITGSGGGVYMYEGTFSMNGGEIFGNSALNSGGGVYIDTRVTFNKTNGTITSYQDNIVNGNMVKNNTSMPVNDKGHAIYVYVSNTNNKRMENTSGSDTALFYNGRDSSRPPFWDGDWDF